jgi:glycosyltransferase involved in cell wall biosynthesis
MKLLALIEGDNEVCCRYRIEAFAEAMAERQMMLEVVRFQKGLLARLGNLGKAKSADAVILQRKLLPRWQTLLLRKWSKRLIFDVDDAVFQRDSNSGKGPESRSRLSRYRAIAARADLVFAGNEYLRQTTSAWTDPQRVILLPTCIDTRKYRAALHRRVGREARLVFIGQQSTLRLLDTAREQLAAVGARMPGMEFRQICDRSAEFPGLHAVLRPWSTETEAAELADGDIGVAWMPDDSWSLGKCGLKVLQYMAAGLPVVANPVGVYREMVIHGETGFLASTPDEWADAVAALARDPQLRTKLGGAGRYLAEKRYSVSQWGARFAELVRGGEEEDKGRKNDEGRMSKASTLTAYSSGLTD